MKVQILGTGCPKCKKLSANAQDAIASSDVEAEVEKIQDIAKIAEFGVMSTPALAIDGDVKAKGNILTSEQIQDLIKGE